MRGNRDIYKAIDRVGAIVGGKSLSSHWYTTDMDRPGTKWDVCSGHTGKVMVRGHVVSSPHSWYPMIRPRQYDQRVYDDFCAVVDMYFEYHNRMTKYVMGVVQACGGVSIAMAPRPCWVAGFDGILMLKDVNRRHGRYLRAYSKDLEAVAKGAISYAETRTGSPYNAAKERRYGMIELLELRGMIVPPQLIMEAIGRMERGDV